MTNVGFRNGEKIRLQLFGNLPVAFYFYLLELFCVMRLMLLDKFVNFVGRKDLA